MDVKVVLVIVCLCAFAITYTEGGIPKCCITVKTGLSKHLLLKVQRYEQQLNTGACEISALRLFMKTFKKPICAHPKYLEFLKRIVKLKRES